MKILWFTNTLMPDAAMHLGRKHVQGTGWWMSTLLERLKSRPDLTLAVATVDGFKDEHFEVDGVDYFVISRTLRSSILGRLRHHWAGRSSAVQIRRFASVVRDWNPDVIHVHGTERDYGMIKVLGLTAKPLVVSIQGLVRPYKRRALGDLLPEELRGPLWHRWTGFYSESYYRWKLFDQHEGLEDQILKSADRILGRTEWDFASAWVVSPKMKYRHVDELMRPEFLQCRAWDFDECTRHEIICTTGNVALKGLHLLLEAIWRLRVLYPDLRLKVASNGFKKDAFNEYEVHVAKLIDMYRLQDCVSYCGWLDAKALAITIRSAHCYVNPSFIENSSNAIQEAMMIGIPIVASACGGTPSILENGISGLLFPPGDVSMLAFQINRIFQDNVLAKTLGLNARSRGSDRQDPQHVESQLLNVYKEVIDESVSGMIMK